MSSKSKINRKIYTDDFVCIESTLEKHKIDKFSKEYWCSLKLEIHQRSNTAIVNTINFNIITDNDLINIANMFSDLGYEIRKKKK